MAEDARLHCDFPVGNCVQAEAIAAPLRAEIERLRAALEEMVNFATFGEQCSSCGKYIAIDGHRKDCSAAAAQRLLSGTADETKVVHEAGEISQGAWDSLSKHEARAHLLGVRKAPYLRPEAPQCNKYGFVPDADGGLEVDSCVYCGKPRREHK